MVAIIGLDQIKPSVTSKIVINGALSYKLQEKTFLMPFEEMTISSMDTFGDDFDALSTSQIGKLKWGC